MSEQIKNLLIGGCIGMVVGVVVMMLMTEDKLDNLQISAGGDKSFSIALQAKSGPKLNQEEILDSIWSHQFAQDGMKGWLKLKEFFHIGDDNVIEQRISGLKPSDKLGERIIAMRDNRKGPFQIIGKIGTVMIPGYEIKEGRINTWMGSSYDGMRLRIQDTMSLQEPIELVCRATMVKPGTSKRGDGFFHMSPLDIKKIFPKGGHEGVIAYTVMGPAE